MKAAKGDASQTPLPTTTTTSSSSPPPAPLKESAQPSETGRAGKDVDNSTSQMAVTMPAAVAGEPPSVPANPETISLPAQRAREQIASGQVIEPLPEPHERRRGQRMVGAARDVVEERIAPRVEKLRQASNVVWGEAQDDPNLRFILVAVFLFILAIVIILLGTYVR